MTTPSGGSGRGSRVVSFVGRSGSGKTTLLEALIPVLRSRGVRVGALKHDAHRFEVDREGKDTFRLRQAGASPVVISSRSSLAVMADLEGEIPLLALVEQHFSGVDLVLTEGYRRTSLPKVWVHREALGEDPDWKPGEGVFLKVTDPPQGGPLPVLRPQDVAAVADAVLAQMFGRTSLPIRGLSLTPAVLVGGLSQRMGSDKAWLTRQGESVLAHLCALGESVCGRTPLVISREGQALPEVSARVVPDLHPGRGPLGGLLTALAASDSAGVLLLACDMPEVTSDLLQLLADQGENDRIEACLMRHRGRWEPMPGVYRAACLPAIHAALRGGELRMDGFLGAVRLKALEEEEWRRIDPQGLSFTHWNRPEDLPGLVSGGGG